MQPSPRFEISRTLWIQILLVLACSVPLLACTNVLVTPSASLDGSTFVTYSCDGGIFAAVSVQPAVEFPSGATSLLVNDTWIMTDDFRPGVLGRLPQVTATYQYLDLTAGPDFFHIGGMNEHGVCIAETTLVGTRPELSNPYGWMAPFSGQAERSLMSLALQRAKTAREAILVMGELCKEYGYRSTLPIEGEQFAIADGSEVWSMEIFGPGPNWRPGSSRSGAVWCAQRVPEGQVAVSANRSRIQQVDLGDPDHFLASDNIYTLAEEMGWWQSDSRDPFIWNQVYAPSNSWTSVVREWRVLDLAASSLELEPNASQLPFAVSPDSPLSQADVIAIQRDLLEGTDYDVTSNPALWVDGKKSPWACPVCSVSYYQLLGIDRARTIANPATSVTCVYQTHLAAPVSLRGCTWFGFGNAATTCYVPLYSGITEIPTEWSATNLSLFDPFTPFWALTLPGKLATSRWQDAYPIIQAVRDPAEQAFIREQPELWAAVRTLSGDQQRVEHLLNEYTAQRLNAVHGAYVSLHAYLLAQIYSGFPGLLAVSVPKVDIPVLPED